MTQPESDTEVYEGDAAESSAEQEQEKAPLQLEVKIAKPSACERHITVTVPREDIERYFREAFDELTPKAELPGFRIGRAPRKLVESRFRDTVAEQVKGKLLMDSMSQIGEDHDFSAISEPEFDVDAIKLPDSGPLTFEFGIEVRPEFDVPEWKGLSLERPDHKYTDAEVDAHLARLLVRYGKSVPVEGPLEPEHFVTLRMTFRRDGQVLSEAEETVPVKPVLSFSDARLEGFDQLLAGKQAGDKISTQLSISAEAEREDLRGQQVDAEFEVLAVKRVQLPELTPAFLEEIGGFTDEADLKHAVREELERQLAYQQQRRIRQQISALLTVAANWDLPPDMLKRQARRELERAVLELRSHGFSDDVIRAHANELRQNTLASTARALKEHFILERIAEDEKIDAEPDDYDREVALIAAQSDESPRRVRARLEKRGLIDTLRNQIIERKVIDQITSQANFQEVPYDPPKYDVAALSIAVAPTAEDIPEAKHATAEELKSPVERG